jgi:hypothetical protein
MKGSKLPRLPHPITPKPGVLGAPVSLGISARGSDSTPADENRVVWGPRNAAQNASTSTPLGMTWEGGQRRGRCGRNADSSRVLAVSRARTPRNDKSRQNKSPALASGAWILPTTNGQRPTTSN